MTSRKVIELFYDVVSPYSWLSFEVCTFSLKVTFTVTITTTEIRVITSEKKTRNYKDKVVNL